MNNVMYVIPKNEYEIAMNEVYRGIEQMKNMGFFSRVEPVTAKIEEIYKKLPYELQLELSEEFFQLFSLTDNMDAE